MVPPPPATPGAPQIIGRYALYDEIAFGGMATVHYGRLIGPVGFSRTVAIKRLHPQHAKDPEFAAMFLDEARLAARIRHPNVVQTLDVVALERELFLVMEYVQGESLSRLVRGSAARGQTVPLEVVSAIMCGALHGLHAAHTALDEHGEPLHIVHRDVSPQNILVGADGVPRVIDFGVAKAAGRVQTTRDGQVKGKFAYMAPEHLRGGVVDARTDVYAAGIVLWEALTQKRLFGGDEATVVTKVLEGKVVPPSQVAPHLPETLDALVLRALERDPAARFESARAMALALEELVPVASATRVAAWVEQLAGQVLAERSRSVAQIESGSRDKPLAVGESPQPAAPEVATQTDTSVSASLARPSLAGSRGRRRVTVAAAVAAVAVLAAVAVVRLRPWTGAGAVAPTGVATTSAPGAPPSDTPSAASAAVAVSAPMVTSPPATASEAPSARPVVAPSPPGRAPAASAKPCVIRSFLDESGIKHYVKECK